MSVDKNRVKNEMREHILNATEKRHSWELHCFLVETILNVAGGRHLSLFKSFHQW